MYSLEFLSSKALFAGFIGAVHTRETSRGCRLSRGVDLSFPVKSVPRIPRYEKVNRQHRNIAVYDEPFSGSFATERITSFTTRNDGGRSKLPARSSVKMPLCDSARSRFTFEFNFISHLYSSSVFQQMLWL